MKKPKAKLEVTTDPDDIAGCHSVVCSPALDNEPLLLPDNVMDWCAKCGCKVQLRPQVPPGPERICFPCAVPELKKQMAKGEDVTLMITPKTVQEVKAYLRKQRKE